MKPACIALCGMMMIVLSGCASNKLRESTESTAAKADKTIRTAIPTYSYEVPPAIRDGFMVTLAGLELSSNYFLKSTRTRDDVLGSRMTITMEVEPVEKMNRPFWRPARNPHILEVIDESGTNILLASNSESSFRKQPFPVPRFQSLSQKEDFGHGYARISALMTKLPRSVKKLRGEAFVEVASSIEVAGSALSAEPAEFAVCDGVKAKAWLLTENQFGRPIPVINVEVRFSAERRSAGSILHAIQICNANNGQEIMTIADDPSNQSVENGEVVVRVSSNKVRERKSEEVPLSIRVAVVPVVQTLTIPFTFSDLPGAEP